MPSSSLTKAAAAIFICDCDEWMRPACKRLGFYKKHEGKQYCVLHYPGDEKSKPFTEELKRKLDDEDFNFCGVWFPNTVDFYEFTFNKLANFSYATFSATVNFDKAKFNAEADFDLATFDSDSYFSHVIFAAKTTFINVMFGAPTYFGAAEFHGEAFFDVSTFVEQAHFDFATFNAEVTFDDVTFTEEAYFRSATFKDYVSFSGKEKPVFVDNSSLNLQFVKIEKPHLFSFHTLTLRPHWFVNVDTRKFEFINVHWDWHDINPKQEVKSLKKSFTTSSHRYRLLAIACRNLAVNAEENHRYEEASRFRYVAMEARRLEHRRGLAFWTLGWWYWLASGYGERVWRAFVVLIGVWMLAAAFYTRVGFVRWEPRVSNEQEAAQAKRDEVGQPLRGWRPLTYSLGVMTLQKPEPRPATDAAQAVVMLEMILGPVQAALLALAIRRKFMR